MIAEGQWFKGLAEEDTTYITDRNAVVLKFEGDFRSIFQHGTKIFAFFDPFSGPEYGYSGYQTFMFLNSRTSTGFRGISDLSGDRDDTMQYGYGLDFGIEYPTENWNFRLDETTLAFSHHQGNKSMVDSRFQYFAKGEWYMLAYSN